MATGSGVQQPRDATLWRRARDGEGWAIAGCALLPFYCAYEELSTTSSEYSAAAEGLVAGAVDGISEGTARVVESTAEPLHEAAEIAKWGAIALAIILALVLVLLGVVAWVYWGPAIKTFVASFAPGGA